MKDENKNAVIGFVAGLIILSTVVLLFTIAFSGMIEDVKERIDDPNYCNEVFERPDDFRPENGTIEEKFDSCIQFVEVDGPELIVSMEYGLIIIAVFPILFVIFMLYELWTWGIFKKNV